MGAYDMSTHRTHGPLPSFSASGIYMPGGFGTWLDLVVGLDYRKWHLLCFTLKVCNEPCDGELLA